MSENEEAPPVEPEPESKPEGLVDESGLTGEIHVVLRGPDGEIKHEETVKNLVTTVGDNYYAAKGIAAIAPASPAAPTAASGMKLGSGATAVAKTGAGAALVTYIATSNNAFDATYPQRTNNQMIYRTTWPAGDVTHAAITEVAQVNDAGADATTVEANTHARALITSVNKTASDSLEITWTQTITGA